MIYTIGHSTRTLTEFLAILHHYKISLLVDIRTIPRSRHNPQFNEDTLEKFLESHGIHYKHLKALGGLRHTHEGSVNTGWHNSSFRGFADYMQTAEFEKGIEELSVLAQKEIVVIMCAEIVPWRCHRSLISDALLVRNFDVEDIFSVEEAREHKMTSFAYVNGLKITYP
jgi:uncharacterized protein (DUF488 family)